jgi:alpha(1,3/1,4) fucosyltransferase
MRVGVTAHFQFSVFSGGGASTVIAVAELLKVLGHDVTLLNLNGTQEWWDDLKSLKEQFPSVNVSDIKDPYDIVFEVGGVLSDKGVRQRCGKQCIWVVRRPMLLNDIESSIFPVTMPKRDLEGLTSIWCLDQEVTQDDIQYLETLARVPVYTVPYVWSPTPINAHRKETNIPHWIQVAISLTQQTQKVLPWSVHICETNNSATSSCTLPLLIVRELKKNNQFFFEKYKIHNAQPVENSQFFKQNVFSHCQIAGISGEFAGRQRIIDWSIDPMSCILGHMRFRRLRPYLLEALWLGIPVVHNAPALKNLLPEYDRYIYSDNKIVEAVTALEQLQKDLQDAKGMFQNEILGKLQQKILEKFSPISVAVVEGWRQAFSKLPPVTVPVTVPVKSQHTNTRFTVLFTDMWDGFNPDYNMFLLILQEGSKNLVPRPVIQGFSKETLPSGVKPNMILFGPFGNTWRSEEWKGIPKAHYTGENSMPIGDPEIFLNMAYPHADFIDEKYIRLPLWMLEIDWFGADIERIQNPKPLPIDRCVKNYIGEASTKEKFCAFVVTNPCNPVRNDAFHTLSKYKKVDSAGRLFNNVGTDIFAGLGGGGGELKKHEFLQGYKFCLAYENASFQGYTTEKLLHAKAAGCIPIYWGDPKVDRDFDLGGFIDARKFVRPEELIEAVRKVDTDGEVYRKMLAVPAVDEYRRDLVRRTFSQIAYRMLKVAYSEQIQASQIPKFLGGRSSEEAKQLAKERGDTFRSSGTTTDSSKINPILVTMASSRFLPSLFNQLSGIAQQRQAVPDLLSIVWLGKDVPEDTEKKLKESFSFCLFKRLPEETQVPGFTDYWDPQHFAWKLWIYHWISQQTEYNGRIALYMDAGIFMCRWPVDWLKSVKQEGICLLEDPHQKNRQWCHETFCRRLNVMEEEKNSQQLIAGCAAFVIGNPLATRLFKEAYEWSKIKEVITGSKWEGLRDGKPFGHRHDQSILSILSQRLKIKRLSLEDVTCDHSLRRTFQSGKAFYIHRGAFVLSKPFAKEINEAYVINLDRREDRMKKLYSHNPELEGRIQRLSAYEGRKIQLTPAIARLFKPHDFLWKKAILGCALSHLQLWWNLVHEKPDIDNYLILEDDVKLQPGWEEKWNAAVPHIPEDYDVIYLGGILPPNRAGFELMKEKVNAHFSRVTPNQMFGQQQANRYFHWCNYSYILSRKGAEKILESLMAADGYYTSADHMVCNRVDKLNHYFLDPLVAGCYQDDDPKYQVSAFNNFNRVDSFDSDLWNNDDRFTLEEYGPFLKQTEKESIDIEKALADGRVVQPKEADKPKESDKPKKEHIVPKLASPPQPPHRVFVALDDHKFDDENAYERQWLQELVGKDVPFRVIRLEEGIDIPVKPIVIVQKPYVETYAKLFEIWEAENFPYYVLHMSDEFSNDPISFYSYKQCLGVVRFYHRSDIPASVQSKVLTIPLGYHWTMSEGCDDPLNKTPRLPFRSTTWSFYGTDWQDRKSLLQPLTAVQPNSLLLVDSWESPQKLNKNQYIARLLDTIFVPCPPGNNLETFRLYEALECGCIPLYVKTEGDDAYIRMLQEELGLLPVKSWAEGASLIAHLMKEKSLLETYRNTVLTQWKVWKAKLHDKVHKLWDL